jgi:cystinosin
MGILNLENCTLSTLSEIIGWAYTIFFSFSYIPQAVLFARTKSVAGFSLDGAHIDFLGNFLYSLYNIAFMFDENLRNKYEIVFGSDTLIQTNDLGFALQTTVTSFIVSSQGLYYGYKENGRYLLNYTLLGKITIILAIIAVAVLLFLVSANFLDLIYLFLGFSVIKTICAVVFYIPQICTNYKYKSTKGFAILGVFFDLSGGLLSFIQLLIDSGNCQNEVSIIWGNPSKFLIGLWTVFANCLLIFQYIYYDIYRSGYSLIPQVKDEEANLSFE